MNRNRNRNKNMNRIAIAIRKGIRFNEHFLEGSQPVHVPIRGKLLV